ncbi:RES family NAD+ phosphorylase [Hymenobacter sp. BT664]|uniref:RES family NAD+ phosphorylase n=1 Tax=Hymenobacter montanus TaxID=2771359 RepID=A0A927GKY7_9BACT|nr:RES family NAD+ phosphorylase [Hymenobacter montanus]MBD2769644.1 RES family NAD+ phosphorylase [Hymenobacter montanus]
MRLYRFGKQPYITDLSGQGGLYHHGRWHRQGTPILYTAEHLSLAKLEMLANSPVLPVNYFALTLEVPEGTPAKQVDATHLPTSWATLPYPQELANITEDWLTEGKFWLMRVPSAHSSIEYNYLLNPAHPDHRLLKVVSLELHPFDTRLK